MLILNLHPILEARGITQPIAYLKRAGFSGHTASNLVHGYNENFRLKFIEQLCIILNCDPHDMLEWRPDKNTNLPETHPLQQLKRDHEAKTLFQQAAHQIPYKQLKQLGIKLNQELKP